MISQEDYDYYIQQKAKLAMAARAKELGITVQEYENQFGTSAITEAGAKIDWSIT
jgi:hypothetical protein